MITKDRLGGIGFAVFGIVVTILATQIKMRANLSEPGPRLFPYIAGIGMCICGLGIALTSGKGSGDDAPYLSKDGWKRLLIAAGVMVLYYLGLEFLGFIISTPIFTFAIILILAGGKKLNLVVVAVIAVVTTAVLYLLFEKVFTIFLPPGIIFDNF